MAKGYTKLLGLMLVAATSMFAGTVPAHISDAIGCSNEADTVREFTIDAQMGWNMVGIPGYKSFPVEELFGDGSKVSAILYFDTAANNYRFYKPDGSVKEFEWLVPGKGYWVIAKEPFKVTVNLTVPRCPQTVGPVVPPSIKEMLRAK